MYPDNPSPGLPLAVIDGTYLTALRSGAASSLREVARSERLPWAQGACPPSRPPASLAE